MYKVSCCQTYFNICCNAGPNLRIRYTKETGIIVSKPLSNKRLSNILQHFGIILGEDAQGVVHVCSRYSSGTTIEPFSEWTDVTRHEYQLSSCEVVPTIAALLNGEHSCYNPLFNNCVDFVSPLNPKLIAYEYFVFFVILLYMTLYLILVTTIFPTNKQNKPV